MTYRSDLPPAANSAQAPRRGLTAVIPWLGAALAVLCVAFVTDSVDVPEVPVGRVVRKDLSAWISTNGKVEPIEPQIVVARVDTFVRDVFVTEGTVVRPGQRLVTLDAAELRAQIARTREEDLAAQQQMRAALAGDDGEELARVEGDLRRNDAELSKLRRDEESLQRLVEKQAATRDELAQAVLGLRKAEAERHFLVQKRAELQQRASSDAQRARFLTERARQTILALEDQLRSTEVAAISSGTVYRLAVRPGQHVQTGDTLAEVADLHHVRVRAFVDEPELGSVALGQSVAITWDALPGRSWAGRTVQMPSSVGPRGGRSVGEVLCSVANDDMTLLPNTNVDVRVRTDVRSRALTVPRSAVHPAGESRYVFVVHEHHLKRQLIRVGISSSSEYEVVDGLAEGDLVVLGGQAALKDGMMVRSVVR